MKKITLALLATTVLAFGHGSVTPQAVDTKTLKQLGAEWLSENPYKGDEKAIALGKYASHHDAGLASKKLKKSRDISFVCAAGNDLGYINDTIVTLPVAGGCRPARARICNNHDGFPFVMGVDTLTALDGIINTRKATVSFLADSSKGATERHYTYTRPNMPNTTAELPQADAAPQHRSTTPLSQTRTAHASAIACRT